MVDAIEMRNRFLEAFDPPEEWEEVDDDFPLPEETDDGFPEDYLRQYQVAGYVTDADEHVGIWWLRDGPRFQAYYDTDDPEWGSVGDAGHIASEIHDRMN